MILEDQNSPGPLRTVSVMFIERYLHWKTIFAKKQANPKLAIKRSRRSAYSSFSHRLELSRSKLDLWTIWPAKTLKDNFISKSLCGFRLGRPFWSSNLDPRFFLSRILQIRVHLPPRARCREYRFGRYTSVLRQRGETRWKKRFLTPSQPTLAVLERPWSLRNRFWTDRAGDILIF